MMITPFDLLDEAIDQFETDKNRIVRIVALYSGGYDSLVTADIVRRWCSAVGRDDLFRVVSIDTLLSADGWREYVSSVALRHEWPFELTENPDTNFYRENVLANGFPYTPAAHTRMYQRLKMRAIEQYLKRCKTSRPDRVLFCTGIRQSESVRRQRLKSPFSRAGNGRSSACFVNPIFYWRDETKHRYMVDRELDFDNPFYETVGGSGDCLCNSFNACTFDQLQRHSPNLATEIEQLQTEAIRLHGYGYDDRPDSLGRGYRGNIARGQLPMFTADGAPVLCYGCERKKSGVSQSINSVIVDRLDWSDTK